MREPIRAKIYPNTFLFRLFLWSLFHVGVGVLIGWHIWG